jgi:hypothetical protein
MGHIWDIYGTSCQLRASKVHFTCALPASQELLDMNVFALPVLLVINSDLLVL